MADADDFNIIPGAALDAIADALWSRLVGAHVSTTELSLRAKLALEQRLYGGDQRPPFGLDRLTGGETADYIGVQLETIHDKAKRRTLGLPQPFHIGRKLFFRRSEIDAWIETQREKSGLTDEAKAAS